LHHENLRFEQTKSPRPFDILIFVFSLRVTGVSKRAFQIAVLRFQDYAVSDLRRIWRGSASAGRTNQK
jgi:hypothetical protein